MVRLSVGVVQMVVVVGMVLILLVVVVVAKWGECKAGVAVSDSVWKSWAISGSLC